MAVLGVASFVLILVAVQSTRALMDSIDRGGDSIASRKLLAILPQWATTAVNIQGMLHEGDP